MTFFLTLAKLTKIAFSNYNCHFNMILAAQLEAKETSSTTEHINVTSQSTITQPRNYGWWLRMTMCIHFLLSGQPISLLLGRLYYDKGGKSRWLGYQSADDSFNSPNVKIGCRDSCCNVIKFVNVLTKSEENESLLIKLINQIEKSA